MKSLLCMLTFSAICMGTIAQTDTLIRYFDEGYLEVPASRAKDTAFTIRAIQPDGSYLVQDFYASTGKIMRRYYSTDASMKVQSGPYEAFHKNGRMKTRGQYNNGLPQSTWKSWDEEGSLADSVSFSEKGNMIGLRITRQMSILGKDSVVYDPDGSGQGTSFGFFANGTPQHIGPVRNNKRHGKWTFYHRSGKIASQETYDMDLLTSIRCFDENGQPKPGKCMTEVDADFPGGFPAWSAYIRDKMESNYNKLNRNGSEGKAVVMFIIDTLGKVSEVQLVEKTNTALDDFALKIIRESPSWIPARWHNVTVKAYRRQPIIFRRS